MSAYSKNYFTNGYVEKGAIVYVVTQTVASYQGGRPSTTSYSVEPYIVTSVGRKYLSAKQGTSIHSPRHPDQFEPIPDSMPGHGLYLEQAKTPLGSKAWRNRLFLHQHLAEMWKSNLERLNANTAASGKESKGNS
ncbi:MAG: hypothetical protein IJT94_01005 [Oscillibacter sp.]|nr:hypothetical protein [Oscillibacter sp.]